MTKLIPKNAKILFRNTRTVILTITRNDDPGFIEEIGRCRLQSFDRTAALTTEPYAIDQFDDYYIQLVVCDEESNHLIGGMRLGRGDEIVRNYGYDAIYTAKYWKFLTSMHNIVLQGLDMGRVWVHPLFQKSFKGLAFLWKGLAIFLDKNPQFSYLFGSVPLTGYPERSRNLIVNYVWKYHSPGLEMVQPRHLVTLQNFNQYDADTEGLSQVMAFRKLIQDLRLIDSDYPVPLLLRKYIDFGAELAGKFAWDHNSDRVVMLLYIQTGKIEHAIQTFKNLD